jgi:hypothetical protein
MNESVVIHLFRVWNDATGDALPWCSERIVPAEHATSWLNAVTCEICIATARYVVSAKGKCTSLGHSYERTPTPH